jgi:hypothetical protein
MSHHSDTLSWFLANQSLLFILNDACLAVRQDIHVYMSEIKKIFLNKSIVLIDVVSLLTNILIYSLNLSPRSNAFNTNLGWWSLFILIMFCIFLHLKWYKRAQLSILVTDLKWRVITRHQESKYNLSMKICLIVLSLSCNDSIYRPI